jgi:hypothetical protein
MGDGGEGDAVKEAGEDEEGKAQDGRHGNTFLCPTCRAPVVLPEGGVAALQVFYQMFFHI